MKTTGGASARTRLTKGQLLEEGKEYGQILPNSGGHENIVMGSEASAEGKEYGQTLPTAEVIMKNEAVGASARRRLTKIQLLEEGKEYGQILPNSGGHYEK